MSFLLIIISIFFIVLSLYRTFKGGLYYILLFVISMYSFFIGLASLDILKSDFADFWSDGGVIKHAESVAFYTTFLLILYYFSIRFSELIIGKKTVGLNEIRNLFNNKRVLTGINLFSFFLLVLNLIYFTYVDWNVVWSNNTYLLISSLNGLKDINSISITLHMLSPLNGLLCCVLLALSLTLKNKISLFFIFIPAVFFIMLKIGDHSRFSAVYMGAMALVFYLSNHNLYKKILFPIFIFLAYLNVLNSLIGRSSELHGVLAIADYFSNIYKSFESKEFLKAISNIFEGAFVHGEAFNFINHDYPTIFKILSISPFPSIVDGYNVNAHLYSLRLNVYVPMGATGELLIFGLNYIVFYSLVIFLAINSSIKVLKCSHVMIFFISLLLIVLASYLQFTYPLRNIMRFLYIAIIINYISIYLPHLKWGK